MGEASRRGTFDTRRKQAIKKNKEKLLDMLGTRDERVEMALRLGIAPFLASMSKGEWEVRRSRILDELKNIFQETSLEKAKPIRVRKDEIGWYIFLCEQALEDPFCTDISQAARATPFFAGIGERWKFAPKVKGIERKILEILNDYKEEPDGLLFEILVALSYAAKGWDVTLIEENPPAKSPDMLIEKEGRKIYVECKRMMRRTSYAEQERNDFLRLWDAAKDAIIKNGQWIWFKGIFHVELSTLPPDFLTNIFKNAFPISRETVIYDGLEAKIEARLIDKALVQRHFRNNIVKNNSPLLAKLLGQDWAPENSSTTIMQLSRTSNIVDCDVMALSTYIEEITWACGFTRDFDSEISLDNKAKDITKLLSKAVKQVPSVYPSIIHIAAETMEGKDVERIRTQKVMEKIPQFVIDKPVMAIRFHRFQANQTLDKLFELDETVNTFKVDGFDLDDCPINVVVHNDIELIKGAHWDIYQ